MGESNGGVWSVWGEEKYVTDSFFGEKLLRSESVKIILIFTQTPALCFQRHIELFHHVFYHDSRANYQGIYG
jgi:hypothetical protein